MTSMHPPRTAVVVLIVFAGILPAEAHHEALFGSPSPLVLSGNQYITAQVFTRQTGPKDERVQETTTVLSGAFSPGRLPISLSVVVPFSVIAAGGGKQFGLENAVVMARYQLDLPAIERRLDLDDSYVLGGGGVEVPTGTIDYDFGTGPPGYVAAGLFSFERRPFSIIGYGFFHRYAERHQLRESGNTFIGTGMAWTPIDIPAHGRVFSLQMGISRETISREVVAGVPLPDSGGWAVVAHPALVWGSSDQVLFFAMTSLPLTHDWRSTGDRERFRVGAGTILTFGE